VKEKNPPSIRQATVEQKLPAKQACRRHKAGGSMNIQTGIGRLRHILVTDCADQAAGCRAPRIRQSNESLIIGKSRASRLGIGFIVGRLAGPVMQVLKHQFPGITHAIMSGMLKALENVK
jgi:hypothetical protein